MLSEVTVSRYDVLNGFLKQALESQQLTSTSAYKKRYASRHSENVASVAPRLRMCVFHQLKCALMSQTAADPAALAQPNSQASKCSSKLWHHCSGFIPHTANAAPHYVSSAVAGSQSSSTRPAVKRCRSSAYQIADIDCTPSD